MTAYVNIAGTWKAVTQAGNNIAGTWKNPSGLAVNIAAVWKWIISLVSPCTISGSLDGTAATGTVTGTLRTITVPVGNTGNVRIQNVINPGFNIQLAKAGVFANISNGMIINYVTLQSLQARCTAMPSPSIASFDIYDDDTGTGITSVTLTRT